MSTKAQDPMTGIDDLSMSLNEMANRMAIEAALVRYTHGVDRIEVEMIKSAFWPDAIDDHGMYVGNAHDFAEFLGRTLKPTAAKTHAISNIHIEFEGAASAKVETYVNATMHYPPELGSVHYVLNGRYLDRFEKRDGAWRIKHRIVVVDWTDVPQDEAAAGIRANHAKMTRRGKAWPDDSWYTEL